MNGHQRRGAGRIDGKRWSVEIQKLGDTPWCHARHHAQEVGAWIGGARDTYEHARLPPAQTVRVVTGVLQRLPRDFEQQPMLRIEPFCLRWGNAEEVGVKQVDAIDEGTA